VTNKKEMVIDKIKALNKDYEAEIVSYRRHLHQYPELSWEEVETTAYIKKFLASNGIPHQQITTSGIVGLIHGKNPDSKCIAIRGDIDALPIAETNTCPYKSIHEGVMHACGHDVHTASVMGAAKILMQLKEEFEGTVKLIFQPSEEKQPSGAKTMIEAGVLKNPDVSAIIAQHVTPELAEGKIGYRSGKFMASADEIYIKVIGKGGHGAAPHKCIDPILMAAQMVIALQQITSRQANPAVPTVLSIGDIRGFGATNIIPDVVELKGTLRTFDEAWRKEMHRKIHEICEGIASAYGGKVEISIPPGVPYVANDPAINDEIVRAAQEYMGESNVVEMDLRMGAEDFSFYTHHIPAAFYRLGTGNIEKNITSNIHTATFDVDEHCFAHSSGLMAYMALQLLKK
jgi:amidohydrolase